MREISVKNVVCNFFYKKKNEKKNSSIQKMQVSRKIRVTEMHVKNAIKNERPHCAWAKKRPHIVDGSAVIVCIKNFFNKLL